MNIPNKALLRKIVIDNPVGLDTQADLTEADKLQLVRSRFEHINELDLQDGQSFFEELDCGLYDQLTLCIKHS